MGAKTVASAAAKFYQLILKSGQSGRSGHIPTLTFAELMPRGGVYTVQQQRAFDMLSLWTATE